MPESDKEHALARLQELEHEERTVADLWRERGHLREAAGHDGRADAFAIARDVVAGVPF